MSGGRPYHRARFNLPAAWGEFAEGKGKMEPRVGLEPTTCGLRNRCARKVNPFVFNSPVILPECYLIKIA